MESGLMQSKIMLMHIKKEIMIDGALIWSKGYRKVGVSGRYEYKNKKVLYFPEKVFDVDKDSDKKQYKPEFINFFKDVGAIEFIEIPTRSISAEMRYNVFKSQNWRCNVCGEKLKFCKNTLFPGRSKEYMGKIEVGQIDHIHPYSQMETYKNGIENINERSNLQALCKKCNREKGIKKIH